MLIYSMGVSVDGFIADRDGAFGWGVPSDEQYCIDILTQVSAMTSALQSVALGLLNDHLRHCVRDAVAEGGEQVDVKLEEAAKAIARLVKS